jgi:DNA-binding LacI/PurR family transcriptional regulator
LARGLRGLPSGLVGVSFPYLEATILSEKGSVLQKELHTTGYRGIFEITRGDAEMEAEVIRHFLSINVEGVVLIAPTLKPDNPVFREVQERGAGIVALDPRHKLPVSMVNLDRKKAMSLILEHLHGLGHRRFGLLGFGSDDMYREARSEGLEGASRKLGIDFQKDIIKVEEAGYSWRDYAFGEVLARKLLRMSGEQPTALICLNDRLAIGAMKALRDAGKSIPGNYSVVGFDNLPESRWTYPALTTVDQNIQAAMHRVNRVLWESIQGKREARKSIDPELIARESSWTAIPH